MNERSRARPRPVGLSVHWLRLWLMLVDAGVVLASFLLAFAARRWLGEISPGLVELQRGLDFYARYLPALAVYPVLLSREGLYPGLWYSSSEELRRVVRAAASSGLVLLTLTFVTQTGEQFSRILVVGGWGMTVLLLPTARLGLKALIGRMGGRGERAVLIGAGMSSTLLLQTLHTQRLPVLDVVAVFDDRPDEVGRAIAGIRLQGGVEQSEAYAKANGIRTAIVAMPELPRNALIQLVERLSLTFHRVVLVPDLVGLSTAETDARDLEGIHALELRRNLFLRRNRWLKRSLDLVGSIVGLLLLSPLLLVISVWILLESGRPLLFRHDRLGKDGRRFQALKFRSMVADSAAVLDKHLAANPHARREWEQSQKLADDPRVTRSGRVLRRWSLDELPQLWNVLRAEMSFVGPRPIVRAEVSKYGEAYSLYTQVRPGITGLWQTRGRSRLDYAERVRLDTYYVRNWSIWLDLVILAKTGWVVLRAEGAY